MLKYLLYEHKQILGHKGTLFRLKAKGKRRINSKKRRLLRTLSQSHDRHQTR